MEILTVKKIVDVAKSEIINSPESIKDRIDSLESKRNMGTHPIFPRKMKKCGMYP